MIGNYNGLGFHYSLSVTRSMKHKNKNMESTQFFWSFFISTFSVLSVWIKPGSKTLTVLLTRLRHCLRGKPHCMYNETKVQIQTNTKYKYKYKTNTKYKCKYKLTFYTNTNAKLTLNTNANRKLTLYTNANTN